MNNSIITIKHLSHTYQTGPHVRAALVDINLEIVRGSCVAIIGVTGSGKSTLVQHLNGLLRPTSGTVIVDGIDVNARGVDLVALRQRVGMLFQFPESQLFEPTVYADVAFGPRRMKLSKREVRTRVFKALETVGLPPHEYAQRSPFDLSGGQMRRVALAGVLAMSPTILVLDEPTTGLDADARSEFYSYLRRVQQEQGVTIILVSHDMAEVATLADWLCVLHDGHLVIQGPPRSIFVQGDTLRTWGLAPPPLSELLAILRQHGVAIPPDVFTLDEAFEVLRQLYNLPDPRLQIQQEKNHV
ncbi:MAG TPA: energy-coupling factor transporter ATPase [Ktedonobacteraceae bacterium]|nr:energy-coupling factor transporter ATPase [Ktedonobacteraceae bacterium]